MRITDIIDVLHSGSFYNCGKYTEIAKGQNEIVTDYKGLKRKVKRLWLLKKK